MDLLAELESMAAAVANMKEMEQEHPETFEYALDVAHGGRKDTSQPTKTQELTALEVRASYLVKLDGALQSAEKVQELAKLEAPPPVVTGSGEFGDATFCQINGRIKRDIEAVLPRDSPRPTFVRINRAHKELSSDSIYPTLGIDATLHQHGDDDVRREFHPAQNEFRFAQKLDLPCSPPLRPASIRGGIVTYWGQKYKALVDGALTDKVDGWAYEVTCEDHEEQLRYFETDRYEVVRCDILMKDTKEISKGLTFRFCGDDWQ